MTELRSTLFNTIRSFAQIEHIPMDVRQVDQLSIKALSAVRRHATATLCDTAPDAPMLTDGHVAFLRLAAQGLTNAEIGEVLGTAEDTVKSRARRAMQLLGARDRTHAVALGFRWGFLSLDDVKPRTEVAA